MYVIIIASFFLYGTQQISRFLKERKKERKFVGRMERVRISRNESDDEVMNFLVLGVGELEV
jgi:hypothetical protein